MKRRILCQPNFWKNADDAMDQGSALFKTEPIGFYILNTYNIKPISYEIKVLRDLQEFKSKLIAGLIPIFKRNPIVDDYIKISEGIGIMRCSRTNERSS